MGDLYEGLLEKNATEKKSGVGQYFTPRQLIDCIVELMQPQAKETIQDPAAFADEIEAEIAENNAVMDEEI